MLSISKNVFFILFIFSYFASVYSQEDYSEWIYSRKITLNTKASGSNISSTVNNFPVLLRLSSDNFNFSQAKANGEDLRFTTSTGLVLPYQIERWDGSSGLAEIWVKVNVIQPNTLTQYFIMRWGNPNATPQSSGATVFNSADNFLGVYHLDEPASGYGNSNVFKDAGGNFNGTDMVTSSRKDGIIGKGQYFDKEKVDYISISQNNGSLSALTLSAWINTDRVFLDTDTSKGDRRQKVVFGNFNWWPAGGYRLQILGSQLVGLIALPDTQWFYIPGAITARKWINIAITWQTNDTLKFYLDGTLIGEKKTPAGTISNSDQMLTISSRDTMSAFDGSMDEIRRENIVRSPDWIKLCYDNQKINQTFYEYGPVEGEDITLKAGTQIPGLDGAKIILHAGSREIDGGKVEIIPGHNSFIKGMKAASDLQVGNLDDQRPLTVSRIQGFKDSGSDGKSVEVTGGSSLTTAGKITIGGGTTRNYGPGGGDL